MEIEPLRRIGYDISAAAMQQELYRLGIDKSVNSLSQADKSLLRYMALMRQTTNAQGDMGATLNTAANQMRILNQQIDVASRWLGAIFVPALNAALKYVIAFTKAIGRIAKAIAEFFHFEMPDITPPDKEKDFKTASTGLENIADSAAKAKKQMNYLIGGFDELNVLDKNAGSGIGDNLDVGSVLGDIELPEYNPFERLVEMDTDEISKKIEDSLKRILPYVVGIGAGFATWKISSGIVDILKTAGFEIKKISDVAGGLKNILTTPLGQFMGWAAVLAVIVGRFLDLYANSESFRKGLDRIGEIFGSIKEVLSPIGDFIKEIGKDFLEMLPPEVQETITNAIDKISEFIGKLDLDVGDLLITLAGIGLMLMPGGQLMGAALLGFEGLSIGIRAFGNISDEEWENIKNGIKEKFGKAVDWVKIKIEKFKEMWPKIKEYLIPVIDGIKDYFSGLITFFSGVFTGDWKKAWEGIKKMFIGIWETTTSLLAKPLNAIIEKFEGLANKVIDAWNAIKRAINSISIDLPKPIAKLVGFDKFGFDLKMTKPLSIPRFAEGGYPKTAQLFYARENGLPEMVGQIGNRPAVANNDQITRAISNAVYNAMMSAMPQGGGEQELVIHNYMDMDGDTVFKNQQKVVIRRGYNFGMGAFSR